MAEAQKMTPGAEENISAVSALLGQVQLARNTGLFQDVSIDIADEGRTLCVTFCLSSGEVFIYLGEHLASDWCFRLVWDLGGRGLVSIQSGDVEVFSDEKEDWARIIHTIPMLGCAQLVFETDERRFFRYWRLTIGGFEVVSKGRRSSRFVKKMEILPAWIKKEDYPGIE